ncbi:hypothetical protein GT50_04755 [Geobacillus stearothermophilus 10]|nr:hypothetical protein GT50_04755 [Geobacillus stearothermophilus 10]
MFHGTAKQGAAKLYKKRKKWYLAVAITFEVQQWEETKVMGVDLGLRYIAVASVGTWALSEPEMDEGVNDPRIPRL